MYTYIERVVGIIVYPDGNSMEIRRISSTFLPTLTQHVPVGRLSSKDIGPSEMLYTWRVQILRPLSKIPKPPKAPQIKHFSNSLLTMSNFVDYLSHIV